MALSAAEKEDIVSRAVEILRAPDKEARLAALRHQVLAPKEEKADLDSDDALYAVLQAFEEVYG
jgi:hypothetical protein